MDGVSSNDAAAARTSAIPRMSKLPQAKLTPQRPGLAGVVTAPASARAAAPIQQDQRQPLGAPRRPQSKQEPRRIQCGSLEDKDRISRTKAIRHPSQQENALQLVESSDGSESSGPSSAHDHGSPIKTPRRMRPSLADRTLESLSQVPPSPASNRRHSSFFNPESPMTPARPPSTSMMNHSALPRANYGAARGNTIPRPTSPSKVPNMAPPSRSVANASTPRSTLPMHAGVKSPQKPNVRNSTIIPKASIPQTSTNAANHGRSMSMLARPTHAGQRQTQPSSQSQLAQLRSVSRPKTTTVLNSNDTKAKGSPQKPVAETGTSIDAVGFEASKPASSSAVLRTQITQAKAARRNVTEKSGLLSPQGPDMISAYNFENCDDPFNQMPNSEQSTLERRIDQARRDGKLNVAAMQLKKIPEEVMKMYETESMEKSSVSWSETVDLVRFNAADNEIDELSDDAFPDMSKESMFQQAEAKGNQFGGIELLDLHGNLLRSVPVGLRRLERLSSLNLARNKLDNSVFSIVTQIHTLRSLNLSSNELTRDLPDSISLLFSLETLLLHSNKLSVLPPSLRELTSLRTLDLSSNRLSSLPIDSLAALPKLQELSAAHNAMTGALFPGNMTGFSKMTHLDVSDNALASLTFSLDPPELPQLVHLNVSRNRMAMMPNMAGWTALATLLAADNMLMALPEGFTSLTRELRRADFAGNSMRGIEDGVARMERLEWLSLQGNPLVQKKYLTMSTEDVKRNLVKKDEVDEALRRAELSAKG